VVAVSDDLSADRERSDPAIEPGDSVRVENVSVDGTSLSSGDEVWVVWRGFERPLPDCWFASRGTTTARVALARTAVA